MSTDTPKTERVDILLSLDVVGSAEELKLKIAEWFTQDDGDFLQWWGPDAWGDYNGDYITGISVSHNGLEMSHYGTDIGRGVV